MNSVKLWQKLTTTDKSKNEEKSCSIYSKFQNRSDVRDYKMPRRKTTRRSRRRPKEEGGDEGKEAGGGDGGGEGGGGEGGGEGGGGGGPIEGGRVGGEERVASPAGEGRVQGGGFDPVLLTQCKTLLPLTVSNLK